MNRSLFLAAMLLVVASFLALPTKGNEATENQTVVEQFVAAVNARDFIALDNLIASDIRRHSAATPGLIVENSDQFKAFLEQDFAAVPDAHQTITHIVSSGDLVAVRAIYKGTQAGAWGPFPPSNKVVEIPFIGILRVEKGKVAEIWVEWDNLNALQQLGHVGQGEVNTRDD